MKKILYFYLCPCWNLVFKSIFQCTYIYTHIRVPWYSCKRLKNCWCVGENMFSNNTRSVMKVLQHNKFLIYVYVQTVQRECKFLRLENILKRHWNSSVYFEGLDGKSKTRKNVEDSDTRWRESKSFHKNFPILFSDLKVSNSQR
jgi:hypothetical protein